MLALFGKYWPLAAFIGLASWYVNISPFNKVEESFFTQAIHDLLYHWPDLSKFDHFEFPGVVPRTFIGSIIVALLTKLFSVATELSGHGLSKIQTLITSRILLAIISGLCWFRLQRAINWKYGSICSNTFSVLSLIQFHSLFYASRTLANTFALCLVYLAYASWLKGKESIALAWLAICACVFRFEIAVMAATLFLTEAVTNKGKIKKMLLTVMATSAAAVTTSVFVDSYFWNTWTWPEFSVLYFNVVLNKSHEWGTQPWSWYIQKALPSTLLMAYPFAVLGLFKSQIEKKFFVPVFSFLTVFSILPHKELRFIFYLIPMLNLAAASNITSLIVQSHKRRHWVGIIFQVAFAMVMSLCLTSSLFRGYVSSRNYPGGEGMVQIHEIVPESSAVKLHIDVETAMSGCSRFLQKNENWVYDKTENLMEPELQAYTHLLTAVPIEGFRILKAIQGFSGLCLDLPRTSDEILKKAPFVTIREEPKVYIMERVVFEPEAIRNNQVRSLSVKLSGWDTMPTLTETQERTVIPMPDVQLPQTRRPNLFKRLFRARQLAAEEDNQVEEYSADAWLATRPAAQLEEQPEEEVFAKSTVKLEAIILAVNISRSPIKVELVNSKLNIKILSDGTTPYQLEVWHNNLLKDMIKLEPGTASESKLSFDLTGGEFQEEHLILVARSQSPIPPIVSHGRMMAGVQVTHLFVFKDRARGSLGARLEKQKVLISNFEVELFEIFGQPHLGPKIESTDPGTSQTSFTSNSTSDITGNNRECVICLSQARDTLFLPCRHMCICLPCAESLCQQSDKCPICRQEFRSMLSVNDA